MMKYVIRHDHEEALRPDPAFVDDMTPATFTEAKQNFLRRGILCHRLLRRMWAPLDLSDLQFERLVQLLEDPLVPRLLLLLLINVSRWAGTLRLCQARGNILAHAHGRFSQVTRGAVK